MDREALRDAAFAETKRTKNLLGAFDPKPGCAYDHERMWKDGFDEGYAAHRQHIESVLDEVAAALILCRDTFDGVDNGTCRFCRIGHRRSDLKGNPQRCEWPDCGSHKLASAVDKIREKLEGE
jgi:hypothetical protein